MNTPASRPTLDALRLSIRRLEGEPDTRYGVLPFGIAPIDAVLPGGGLRLGALHEIGADGCDMTGVPAGTLFATGIAARTKGKVLWIATCTDIFAPALRQAGLSGDRVVHATAADDGMALACFEEALRHRGLGAVVAEVAHLNMTTSRRLQLAAERSGTMGIALRRASRGAYGDSFGQPTAAVTRWRVSSLPTAPLPVRGVGHPRWHLELIRTRAGLSAAFDVEACDAQGRIVLVERIKDRLDLSTNLADGPPAPKAGRTRAHA